MFELTWLAICDGALELIASQTVVQRTRALINDSWRDRIWASIWEIWDNSWGGEAYETAQSRVIRTLDTIVKEVLDTAVEVAIEDMRESKAKTIQARILKVSYSVTH